MNFRLRWAAETEMTGCNTRPEPEPRACATRADIRARRGIIQPVRILKNLPNMRICHVRMMLAISLSGVLGCRRVSQPAAANGDRGLGRYSCRMERALKHKYSVGATVYFTASNIARPAATGTYEVIRLLPTEGDDCQYRIKSANEAFERVAKESQLALT